MSPTRWPAPAFVLLVMTAALALAAGGAAQGGTLPDLRVTEVRVVGPWPAWTHGEPTKTSVQLTVTNVGGQTASGYAIEYEWVRGGQVGWMNEDQGRSVDAEYATLDPGISREHEPVDWRLQPGQRDAGALRVSIRPFGADGSSANNMLANATFVPVHDVALSMPSEDVTVLADEIRFVRVTVANRGNTDETLSVRVNESFVTPPERAEDLETTLQDGTMKVAPGASGVATLFVRYAFSGVQDPFDAAFHLATETEYGRVVEAAAPPFQMRTGTLAPGSPVTLDRTGTTDLIVDADGELIVPFRLVNDGMKSDTYTVSASGSPGWDATAPTDRIGLHPGEEAGFPVRIVPPPDAPSGTPGTFTVSVQSDRPADPHEEDWPVRVDGPSVRLVANGSWSGDAYVGEPAEARIHIKNVGSQPTPADATIEVRSPDLDEATTVVVPAPVVAAGASQAITVPVSEYATGGTVRFEAEWVPPDGILVDRDGLAHDVFVHAPAFDVAAPPDLEGAPGETVAYRTGAYVFTLRNEGNAEETLLIHARSDAGTALADVPGGRVTLGPGETRSIPLDHRLPLPSGTLDEVHATVEVALADHPGLAWNATVATRIVDENPPVQAPEPLPALWTLGEPMPVEVAVDDDAAVKSVEAAVADPGGDTHTTALGRQDDSGPWTASVELSGPGNYTVAFSATDVHGNEADVGPFAVEVREVPPPRVELSGPEPQAIVQPDEEFEVAVNDTLPLTRVTARAVALNETVHWTRDLTVDESRARFNLSGTPDGLVRIEVEAVNSAGSRTTVERMVVVERPPEATQAPVAAADPTPTSEAPGAAVFGTGLALLMAAVQAGRRGGASPANRTRSGQKRRIPSNVRRPVVKRAAGTGSKPAATRRPPQGERVPKPPLPRGRPVVVTRPRRGVPANLLRSPQAVPKTRRVRTPRSTGPSRRLAVLLAIVVAAPVVLGVISPPPSSEDREDRKVLPIADGLDASHAAGRFLASLPPPTDARTVLGAAKPWILDKDELGVKLREPPEDVDGVLDLIRADVPWDPLPVPDPPAHHEPLLVALGVYLLAMGHELPDVGELRAQIASLRLQPAAERALAQLVMAYVQAVALEQEATSALTPDEALLLGGASSAVSDWFSEDADRTRAELEAVQAELASRIDLSDRLRAADLLLRTIDEVRGPLSLAPSPAASSTPEWDKTFLWMEAVGGLDEATLPRVPDEPLEVALARLAWTVGFPADDEFPVPPLLDSLPPSLADAVAQVLTARRVGMLTGDAAAHGRLLAGTVQDVEPTMRAWSLLLELESVLAAGHQAPDVGRLVATASERDPMSSAVFSAAVGVPVPDAPAPPPLRDLLVEDGVGAEEADRVVEALPERVALAVAHVLDGMRRSDAVQDLLFAPLEPDARHAVAEETDSVLALLDAGRWSVEDAALVSAWARGVTALGPQGIVDLHRAQAEVLAAVEAARAVLMDYHREPDSSEDHDEAKFLGFIPPIHLIQTASAQPGPACPGVPEVSDCANDVWVRTGSGSHGVLVTGFGRSVVTPTTAMGNPALIIDLGGDDEYRIAVATADTSSPVRVLLDVGGSDVYETPGPLAFGAAKGLGSVGVLWDEAGDDVYRHTCEAACEGAQGYGATGAVGVLLDRAGRDLFEAPKARAHGVGWSDAGVGGIGLLLDSGDGDDRLVGGRGQGYAHGDHSVGVVVNAGTGANHYETVDVTNIRFQGGHETGGRSVGILVDLGGDGTFYNNLELPDPEAADTLYRSHEMLPRWRKDDAMWGERNAAGGFSLGIDSTHANEDSDPFPNLAELVAGSDPHDGGSTPGGGETPDLVGLVTDFIGDPTEPPDLDPEDALSQLAFAAIRDNALCADPAAEDGSCGRNMSVMHLAGIGDDVIREPALVMIELGGDDVYQTEVAGFGDFHHQGEFVQGAGSFALDLAGDDKYDTPGLEHTQAAVRPQYMVRGSASICIDKDCFAAGPGEDEVFATYLPAIGNQNPIGEWGNVVLEWATGVPVRANHKPLFADGIALPVAPASMLVDLAGNDTYVAGARSQASAYETGCVRAPNIVSEVRSKQPPGAAWLVDMAGDDDYRSGSQSQASVVGVGGQAGLIDLAGDDVYTFAAQAAVTSPGVGAIAGVPVCDDAVFLQDQLHAAVLYDGSGRDTYNSSEALVPVGELDHATPTAPENDIVFETQGIGRPAFALKPNAFGVFIDDGPDFDRYVTRNESDGFSDVSHIKNDRSDRIRQNDGEGGFFFDGLTWFASADDGDGDGSPDAVEFVAGTDPQNSGSHAGNFWRNGTDAADESGPWFWIRGGQGDPGVLPISAVTLQVPGLLVGGRADTLYDETAPFTVALGGNNTYTAPFVGGSDLRVSGAPTLLVDLGLNTTYRPDAGACSAATRWLCPSLGGATNGFAILADAGGANEFDTSSASEFTSTDSHTFDVVSQGAAVNSAIGALVTWNATNSFRVNASVVVETPPAAPVQPRLTLRGVAQGTAVNGVGLLASMGQGNDTFEVLLYAAGGDNPTTLGLAQGAALDGFPGVGNTFTDRRGDEDSFGFLLDGGGANHFIAPSGFSQGFASAGGFPTITNQIGVLWSGTGDDRFVGGRYSQGTAVSNPTPGPGSLDSILSLVPLATLGLLYDAGGSDRYSILPVEHQGVAMSQGASAGAHAVGAFVDASGDDWYEASEATHVQGVSTGGAGLLLDLGGNDRYQAAHGGQGYVSDAGSPESWALALLLEFQGRDRYELNDLGQGFADVPTCGSYQALFVDGHGEDSYLYGGTKVPAGGAGQAPDDQDNDWVWTPAPAEACGLGIDSNQLNAPLTSFYDATQSEVRLRMFRNPAGDEVASDAVVRDDLVLRAEVIMVPPDPDRIDRVAFLVDNRVIGHGVLQPSPPDGPLIYETVWQTSSGNPASFPDGPYALHAAVFLSPDIDVGVARPPDLPSLESRPPFDVTVDNPPRLEAEFEDTVISPAMSQQNDVAIDVGRDRAWPQGVDPVEACAAFGTGGPCQPGAWLELARESDDGAADLFFREYRPAGTYDLPVTARDGTGTWDDGWYDIGVTAEDAAGNRRQKALPPLLVDSAPPTSWVTTPAFAGVAHSGPGRTLSLEWGHDDAEGSGVTQVCVFRMQNNEPVEDPDCRPPSETRALVAGVSTGTVVEFVTVAIDAAGNPESECRPDEAPVEPPRCFRAKLDAVADAVHPIVIDFDPPVVQSVAIDGGEPSEAVVRPGDPVTFTVRVSEVGTGIHDVEIRLPARDPLTGVVTPAAFARPMQTDGTGLYWYDAWHEHNHDIHGGTLGEREEEFGFSVVATDQAANRVVEEQWSVMDSLRPRVVAGQTTYAEIQADGTERTLAAGRPGVHADLRLRVEDASLQAVTADVREVATPATAHQPCDPVPQATDDSWTCRLRLRSGLDDGVYHVPLTATDRAGNSNVTETATVRIASRPLGLEDIGTESLAHDGFVVTWSTPFEGTSRVEYGRTSQLGTVVQPDEELRKDHSVAIAGLSPSSRYFFKVVSENEAGITNESDAFEVTTVNAYAFDVQTGLEGAVLQGEARLDYDLVLLAGDEPVDLRWSVQDAGQVASPVEMGRESIADGPGSVTLDATQFDDGTYRVLFDLDRAGDPMRFMSPPFRVDNTPPVLLPVNPRPGQTIADPQPTFELVMVDPLGTSPPDNATMLVQVGGVSIPHEVASDDVVGSSTSQRRVAFNLSANLTHGTNRLVVSVADEAGNVGETEWLIRVDSEAPRMPGSPELSFSPGPELARPDGRVAVAVRLQDESRVAGARLNVSVLGGDSIPMYSAGGNRWEASIVLPHDVAHGTIPIPVVATDGLGNRGVAGILPIIVDARPPVVTDVSVQGINFTGAEVTARTDEPVVAWLDGFGQAPSGTSDIAWETQHSMGISGMRPGERRVVEMHVMDRAGNRANASVSVETTQDDEPPGPIDGLTATSAREGVVRLSWTSAHDNVGLEHYVLGRTSDGTVGHEETILEPDTSGYLDADAPAGRLVKYTVYAVDMASHSGPAANATILVRAIPHLSNASVSPLRGPSNEPFTFQVDYRHAGGEPADSVVVEIGSATHPLLRADSDPCDEGCRYRANVLLPPSSFFQDADGIVFHAVADGQEATLNLSTVPNVMRGPGAAWWVDQESGRDANTPAVGPGLVALTLVAAAAASYRRGRDAP